jgi:restriction endonuclease Mrr
MRLPRDLSGRDLAKALAKQGYKTTRQTSSHIRLTTQLNGEHHIIFFGTSTLSQGARDYVGRISKRLVLIDGAELARLMVRHNVGVRTRTTYEVKKIDEDYFTE